MEIIIITSIALIIGIISIISSILLKDNDEQVEKYLKLLPNFNCGACGYGSCKGMAEVMCKDIESYKKCRPLRGDKLEHLEEAIKNKTI